MNTVKINLKARKYAILRVMRMLRVKWRKYASLPVMLLQIAVWVIWGNVAMGYVCFIWLIIPCGIKIVNTNKLLWFGRQFAFSALGLLNILSNYA